MPLTFIQNSTGTFRLENSDGTQWLVVGGVPAREQVMNNYLVPGPEIVKSLPSWNGVPITIRHPKTNGGSIKTPKPDVPIIGKFKGPTWDQAKKRMTGEYWIDLEAARLSPDGQILVNKIMAGHPVETSTAYFSKDVYIAGTHAGRNYAYINRELKPDHIAILPDEVGACSLKDGCGLNVNAAKKNCSSCPALNGGAGSGNFGHEGIPGHQGGSEPNGGNEIVGRYRINNGKATVTIVNAGANLTPETINAIRSAEDGTVRVIYNTSTNHWHIPDQGLMEVDHGNFIVEALEGYTPAYTEMIEVRGIYDINSNEITLYDFQGIADGIAAENGVNERVVSHQVGKAMDEAEHKYFYLNGKKPTVTVIPFEEVAGFSTNGGEGSGNFGHEGIPGHQGGSEPNGGSNTFTRMNGKTPYTTRTATVSDRKSWDRGYEDNSRAGMAWYLFKPEVSKQTVLVDGKGDIQAVYSGERMGMKQFSQELELDEDSLMELSDFTNAGDRPYLLEALAVAPINLTKQGQGGWGVDAFYQAAMEAKRTGADFIFLSPADNAKPFYEALGMGNWNDTYMVMPEVEMDKFISAYEARSGGK
jgi:hypothetical protein